MKYCDLCQAFYISTTTGGLKEFTSQGAISKFFIEMALKEESKEVMPYDSSAYDKWFSGTNGQKPAVWKAVKKDLIEDKYAAAIVDYFDRDQIEKVAGNFGIKAQEGEKLKLKQFATAIALQMHSLAEGKGEADDVVYSTYMSANLKVDFVDYIQKATERFNVMKLIGGDEVPLEKYFVCNTLGEKQRVLTDKNKIKCKYLDDATIESVREMYKDRHFDNKKTIIIGSGGSGKTLMLQHLFLDGLSKYPETGILPIFLELRYFTQSDDIENFIVKTVQAKDESFTEEVAKQLLFEGRCPILMDGLDEIDPSDIKNFQIKLNAFTDKYSRTQVILASRDCDAITGLNGYVKLYVWPFDNEQSEKLIDKILTANRDMAAKDKVLEYIANGFIKKDGAFVSHPMLLTFVAMNYPKYDTFTENPLLFYKKAYEALLTGHDDNKKPYDRVFHSVDTPEDFSTVFREFCGETYRRGVLKFDSASFDMYFSELKSYKEFKNPHKMNAKSFRQDACATACMMYESDLDIFYIDPGFQEFLFAEYYAQQGTDKVKELGESLRGQPLSAFGKLDAFEMLYNFSKEKVEVGLFLPFLDSIFKGKSDEEAFAHFLTEGYETITYSVINEELVKEYEEQRKVRREFGAGNINEPSTVILSYILKLKEETPWFMFSTSDANAEYEEFAENVFTGEYAGVNGEPALVLSRKNQKQFANRELFERTYNVENLIRDKENNIVCFGHDYKIDSYDLEDEPEKFSAVIQTMMTDEGGVYGIFERLKAYYKQLAREQRRNRFR